MNRRHIVIRRTFALKRAVVATLGAVVLLLAAIVPGAVASTPTTYSFHDPPPEHKGYASIVFFYTDDSPEELFCQSSIKLKKAMDGYDKVILLMHNEHPSFIDLTAAAEALCDAKETPTQAHLEQYLTELTGEGYTIDLYIIGHGRDGAFLTSAGTYGTQDWVSSDEVKTMAWRNGYSKFRLRMVWSTLCYGSTLNDAWTQAGAMAVAGARYVFFYPNQFGNFADKWTGGEAYKNAVQDANTAASRTVVQGYLSLIHAPTTKSEWGGCPLGSTILGSKDCAADYFGTMWGLKGSEWQDSMSGKDNMNYSSRRIFAGSTGVKKTTKWKS